MYLQSFTLLNYLIDIYIWRELSRGSLHILHLYFIDSPRAREDVASPKTHAMQCGIPITPHVLPKLHAIYALIIPGHINVCFRSLLTTYSGLRPQPINYLENCGNGLHYPFINILSSQLLLNLVGVPPDSFYLQGLCKL